MFHWSLFSQGSRPYLRRSLNPTPRKQSRHVRSRERRASKQILFLTSYWSKERDVMRRHIPSTINKSGGRRSMQSVHFQTHYTRGSGACCRATNRDWFHYVSLWSNRVVCCTAQHSLRSVRMMSAKSAAFPSLPPAVTVSEPLAMSTGPSSIINIYRRLCATGVCWGGGAYCTLPLTPAPIQLIPLHIPQLRNLRWNRLPAFPGDGNAVHAVFRWVEENLDRFQLEGKYLLKFEISVKWFLSLISATTKKSVFKPKTKIVIQINSC